MQDFSNLVWWPYLMSNIILIYYDQNYPARVTNHTFLGITTYHIIAKIIPISCLLRMSLITNLNWSSFISFLPWRIFFPVLVRINCNDVTVLFIRAIITAVNFITHSREHDTTAIKTSKFRIATLKKVFKYQCKNAALSHLLVANFINWF